MNLSLKGLKSRALGGGGGGGGLVGLYKNTGLDKQNFLVLSYPSVLTYVLGAQKNRLILQRLIWFCTVCGCPLLNKQARLTQDISSFKNGVEPDNF